MNVRILKVNNNEARRVNHNSMLEGEMMQSRRIKKNKDNDLSKSAYKPNSSLNMQWQNASISSNKRTKRCKGEAL
jgi:hypothetical protein